MANKTRAAALVAAIAASASAQDVREKAVVFARELTCVNQAGEQYAATAWEWVPSAEKLEKRHHFAKSSWAPDLLFREGEGPEGLVRLQVDSPKRIAYEVDLFAIDYREWRVTPVYHGDRLNGLGASQDVVYLDTDEGVRLLDRKTLALRAPDVAWRLVRQLGDRWLVAVGERDGALLDPATGALSSRFALPERWAERPFFLVDRYDVILSPDHARIAAVDVLCRDDPKGVSFGESRVLKTKLEVLELATGKVATFPLRLSCLGGSGRPVIPRDLRVEFTRDSSKLVVWSQRARDGAKDASDPDENELEELTLDTSLEVVARATPKKEPTRERAPEVLVPDWLKKDYDALGETSDEGGRRLAVAFLRSRGVDVKLPVRFCDAESSFTRDGKRFFFKLAPGDAFYFGDLDAKTLKKIPCPPSLRSAAMRIVWVNGGK